MSYIDTTAYKAFRIVLLHFIGPCIKAGEKKKVNMIKIWWRRINGYHNYKLYKPRRLTISPPPGLWRQSNGCMNSRCVHGKYICNGVPKRWVRKNTLGKIKTRHIQKFIRDSILYSPSNINMELETRFSEEELLEHGKYWIGSLCACDNKPARIIIDYKTRYNNMESIYRELASDNLTYRTRSIVSKFVRDRFRPNLNM